MQSPMMCSVTMPSEIQYHFRIMIHSNNWSKLLTLTSKLPKVSGSKTPNQHTVACSISIDSTSTNDPNTCNKTPILA